MKTQSEKIFWWLYKRHTLTPLQALKYFGCFRLGARIYELRKMGFKIETKYVTRNGKTYAEYRMV